ncbi:alpha-mannosidase [Yoonia sp. 208BN28-4]|uniref:alpha-mannosidase n=1 Tax=Yoonia sp. 208BN28-4 TaxID=3126505 RepID=UPI0030A5E72E
MKRGWPFTAEKIAAHLQLIAPYVHRHSAPLPHFRVLPLDGPTLSPPICADHAQWDEIPHETYWGHADLNFVMKSSIRVPDSWSGDDLALHLPLGVLGDVFNHPEALVYVDNTPIGSADRYHHTITLDPALADGRDHVLSLHGWTGLAGWPPDPHSRSKLLMGWPAVVQRDPALLSFVQLAKAALDSVNVLDTETGTALLDCLDSAMRLLDTRDPIGDALYASAPAALDHLRTQLPLAGPAMDVTLHGIGHAHMDIAYLWTIDQIRLKNARTYTNVLRLMEADPDFRFSHSQPQLYAYTETDHPALFAKIKARVAEGRWEVMGGMWVEPDLNTTGPEALIRQLVLGRTYFRDRFGDVETPVLWLPDTFGFPAQIPQLMKLAGLEWFVTNKLNWNQCNPVPCSTHHWEGLDGSRVLAHILTTPRDVQYLPFPTNYKSDLSAPEVLGTVTRATSPDNLRDLPICFGYGDGGGGPTEDLLAKARAFGDMPGMPRFRYSSVRALFAAIADTTDLPVWRGEHYMEGHRGTYTSQGWIKRANRKAEWALHEAEALAAMAGHTPDLSQAWQLLCLNQFHDIITGTSITPVFEEARRDYVTIATLTEAAAQKAADALRCDTASVINTAPTAGARLATIPDADPAMGQPTADGVLVHFPDLQPYAVTAIAYASLPDAPVTISEHDTGYVLENGHVKVALSTTGTLDSVFDKSAKREILTDGTPGNQLIAFEDRPICWDAWDIDPSYEDRWDIVTGDTNAQITETGPLRVAITFTTRWRSSVMTQTVRLCAHSARVDFVTDVDWHETHTLLKAAFDTTVISDHASFDTQWGRVTRSTRRDTDFDAARFEVPAQKWANLHYDTHGVAVLNDCKYGYDVLGGRIRITLIKSATVPDPQADQGPHQFTYALLPYAANNPALLDHEAYDLNAPLRVLPAGGKNAPVNRPLVQCAAPNVVVETVKPSDTGDGVVIRIFEAHGQATDTTIQLNGSLKTAARVTIFEDHINDLALIDGAIPLSVGAFEIITLLLRP